MSDTASRASDTAKIDLPHLLRSFCTSSGVPSRDDVPAVQHVTRSASASAMSMSCSIMTTVMSRGSAEIMLRKALPFAGRQPGAGLVEQQHFGIGMQRERQLELPALAVGQEFHRRRRRGPPRPIRSRLAAIRAFEMSGNASPRRIIIHLRRSIAQHAASSRFSRTDRSVQTLEIWNVRPMPSAVRRFSGDAARCRGRTAAPARRSADACRRCSGTAWSCRRRSVRSARGARPAATCERDIVDGAQAAERPWPGRSIWIAAAWRSCALSAIAGAPARDQAHQCPAAPTAR